MKIEIPIVLPPATKLGQGNIFSSVCQEFCPRGGRECLGRYPPSQAHPPGRCTLGSGTPPGQVHNPWAGSPPWGGTPPSRYTFEQVQPPQAGTPSRQVHPPWSMSGRYASYWNAFLLDFSDSFPYFSEIQREASTLNINVQMFQKNSSNFNFF